MDWTKRKLTRPTRCVFVYSCTRILCVYVYVCIYDDSMHKYMYVFRVHVYVCAKVVCFHEYSSVSVNDRNSTMLSIR